MTSKLAATFSPPDSRVSFPGKSSTTWYKESSSRLTAFANARVVINPTKDLVANMLIAYCCHQKPGQFDLIGKQGWNLYHSLILSVNYRRARSGGILLGCTIFSGNNAIIVFSPDNYVPSAQWFYSSPDNLWGQNDIKVNVVEFFSVFLVYAYQLCCIMNIKQPEINETY